jgi:hypothetical protein
MKEPESSIEGKEVRGLPDVVGKWYTCLNNPTTFKNERKCNHVVKGLFSSCLQNLQKTCTSILYHFPEKKN